MTLAGEPIVTQCRPFGIIITGPEPWMSVEDLGVDRLRDVVSEHKVVVLRGFTPPAGAEALVEYSAAWGNLLEWSFGFVFDVLAHSEPEDHAFDTGFMPMHWDGMYADFVPQHQVFHCVTAPPTNSEGGRTLFCDTTSLLSAVAPGVREAWEELTLEYTNPKLSHYGGMVVSPLIEKHPVTGVPVLRFLEPAPSGETILNPPTVHIRGVTEERETELLAELSAAVRDPRFVHAHTWQEGDVVITDNYALLHTREAYAQGLPRHLRRVHVLGDPAVRSRVQHGHA